MLMLFLIITRDVIYSQSNREIDWSVSSYDWNLGNGCFRNLVNTKYFETKNRNNFEIFVDIEKSNWFEGNVIWCDSFFFFKWMRENITKSSLFFFLNEIAQILMDQ